MSAATRVVRTASATLWLLASGAPPTTAGGAEPALPALTLWAPSAKPAIPDVGPDKPVELGVRIRTDVPGRVVGIRFYKADANSGEHVVHLWTSEGDLLAQARPRAETTRGWQRADFSRPVAVDPGKVYVASYHAPTGHFSVDHGAFAGKGVDRPPLHALADGPGGANGVFGYGPAGTFPARGYRSSNYWVDVVFQPAASSATTLLAIEVNPRHTAVGLGDAVLLRATGRFGDGRSRDITSMVRWSSDGDAAFTVSESGRASAVGPGAAIVSASLASVSGTAALVAVSPPPEKRTATAPAPDLAIATVALPDGMLGVAYAGPLVAAGGTGPYRWAMARDLPSGLRLDELSGVITGKPAATGSFEVRAIVTDAGGRSAARTLRMAIGPASFGIWPRAVSVTADDSGPGGASEAGVRFRSEVAGYVVAIRYHRKDGDPGSQVVHLWTGDGKLLAEARADLSGGSGWQEVQLPRPVAIEPGISYVASRRLEGPISVTKGYFEQGLANPPLHVEGEVPFGAGGVFASSQRRRPPSLQEGFPADAFEAANPWVDVVFIPSSVPPALASLEVTPRDRQASLGEPQQFRAIGVDTGGRESDLTRLAEWDASDPVAVSMEGAGAATSWRSGEALIHASFRGLSGSVRMVTPDTGPAPDEGPGGPILVITGSASGFSRFLAEILRTEGLNEFLATDVSRLDAALLAQHDLVILGDVGLTDAQAATVRQWVMDGGNLIAMRPDRRLASLLGLRQAVGVLGDAYLKTVEGPGPGRGITARSMQFHGVADLYRLDGATSIADLYRTRDLRAGHPAVTLRNAGRGQAAAFAYDLARSVVYTRQGNPAWSRQSRSGGRPRRSHDLFYGHAAVDPQPDWVDFSRIDVPQADEQQRLLVNLILHMNQARKPLPRFWYLPSGHRAVVLMTGDEHAIRGPAHRLEEYLRRSRPGCSVEDWECVRSTAYVYATDPLTAEDALRFTDLGFEIALHPTTDCKDYESRSALEDQYARQLATFAANYPGLPRPSTNRTHCVAWSDYDTQPKVESMNGIRLDTNYYYYPSSWVADRPGFMTGSALPMRFADRAGRVLDVFQVATQMTDESGQAYPATIEVLIRNALGPAGYYGVFAANMHSDSPTSPGSDAILAAAEARGVPVISARQLLTWLDARDASSFASLRWEADVLSFTVSAPPEARNLQGMLPVSAGSAVLAGLHRGRDQVPFSRLTIKGVEYAVFTAVAGDYRATYRSAASPRAPSPTSSGTSGQGAP